MPQISLYISADALGALRLPEQEENAKGGGGRSAAISQALERYYGMLERARRTLRKLFTDAELALMADAGNGTLWNANTIPLLQHEIADAIELDGLDSKWEVDGPALLEKLAGLGLAETFALADGIERYWSLVERGEKPSWSVVVE